MQHAHGAAKRAQLGSYLSRHPKKRFCQFWVLTGGERVEAAGVRKRFARMTRALSKFIAYAKVEFPWVEFVARMNEITVDADKTCHPHINLCAIFLQAVPREELLRFSEGLRKAMKGWVYNARSIKSVDEFIKYTTKFGISIDEDGNERASSSKRSAVIESLQPDLFDVADGKNEDILATLYREQFHARAFAAFGPFAEYRRRLEERRLMPKRVGDDYMLIRKSPYRARQKKDGTVDQSEQVNVENLFLAVSMPHPHGVAGTLIEPTLRIIGYTESPTTEAGRDRLAAIRAVQERLRLALIETPAPKDVPLSDNVVDLAAARAARAERSYIVHTGTLSVRGAPSLLTRILPSFCATKDSQDGFDSIDGTSLVLHKSSLAVFDCSNVPSAAAGRDRAGFTHSQYSRIPLVAPDPLHEAVLAAWAAGREAPARRDDWENPGDWRQYWLPLSA